MLPHAVVRCSLAVTNLVTGPHFTFSAHQNGHTICSDKPKNVENVRNWLINRFYQCCNVLPIWNSKNRIPSQHVLTLTLTFILTWQKLTCLCTYQSCCLFKLIKYKWLLSDITYSLHLCNFKESLKMLKAVILIGGPQKGKVLYKGNVAGILINCLFKKHEKYLYYSSLLANTICNVSICPWKIVRLSI